MRDDSDPGLAKRIEEWLSKGGYPLEMQTAALFRKEGFDITPSYSFPDPDTGKNRELDVVASTHDRLGFVQIGFLIECKSTDKPWVVLRAAPEDAGYSGFSGFGMFSETASRAVLRLLGPGASKTKWFTGRTRNLGYGLKQAFCGDNDPAYAATVSVVKACASWLQRPNFAAPRLVFAIPLIVVDSPLFECSLCDREELDLTRVNGSGVMFSQHSPDQSACLVHVVTKPALPVFASAAKDYARDLITDLQPEIDEWIASQRARNHPRPSSSSDS